MSSAIEATVKALVEFESELEKAKAEASEAKRRATKDAVDWAEAAKSSAISRAQEIGSQRVAEAKAEAEKEAERIKEKGASDLKAFESSISRHKPKAAELVASRLLGEKA
jgi:F0F1-type ATP synthase membrane subunit b/b'